MIQPSLAEVIGTGVASGLLDVHTVTVARVEKWDATEQTVDCQPLIKRALSDASDGVVFEQLPIVPNVPVVFPCGGGCSITWPLAVGDFVLLLSTDRSIDGWRATGQISEPADLRQHSLGSCVAIAGVVPTGTALPSATGSVVVDAPTEIKLGASATDYAALAAEVKERLLELGRSLYNSTEDPDGAILKVSVTNSLTADGWSKTYLPNIAASKVKVQ